MKIGFVDGAYCILASIFCVRKVPKTQSRLFMALISLPRWFKKTPPLLVLQLAGDALRFMVREGERVVQSGEIRVANLNARMFDVAAAHFELFAQLDERAMDVAVLLPAASVHTHYLSVPTGLDAEELDYQVTRHITQGLGLSVADVYYDWSSFSELNGQSQTILLVVARQSEVAQYAQLCVESSWRMRWVCAEPLIWMQAFKLARTSNKYAVCQVEHSGTQLYWFDEAGHVKVLSKFFDRDQMSSTGFEYVSDEGQSGQMQLPLRFVVNEIDNCLTQALGAVDKNRLDTLYVLGAGANWNNALTQLQSRFGLAVRTVRVPEQLGEDERATLGGMWHLSEQIIQERR